VSATTKKKRVAALISGRGSNMLSLMAAARQADYPADIALVFSNKPDAAGLATAKEAGIATASLFHKDFATREDFERAMQDILLKQDIDLICLAGFMRLLTPWFVEQWSGRMINIHPAILPSYKGLHTHERALADGVKLHGATVHFVVPEMDAGPIIAQAAVPVVDGDTPETLGARVLKQEHIIYPLALKLVASGEAKLVDGKVLTGETLNEKTLVVPMPSLRA
jgi:phosphoribosylglycinamide formyltransferase 1